MFGPMFNCTVEGGARPVRAMPPTGISHHRRAGVAAPRTGLRTQPALSGRLPGLTGQTAVCDLFSLLDTCHPVPGQRGAPPPSVKVSRRWCG
jgi:hypothetical protein